MIPDIRPLLTKLLKPHLKHAEEYGEARGFVSAAVNVEAMIPRFDTTPMSDRERQLVRITLEGVVDGLLKISTTVMAEDNPYPMPRHAIPRVS